MVESPPRRDNRPTTPAEWYDEELYKLQRERSDIIQDASSKTSQLFPHLECQVQLRMKIAADYRDLQLNNVYNHYKSEVQQAWNEFERGKRRLQSAMLDISADRRKRIDSLRHSNTSAAVAAAVFMSAAATSSSIIKKRRRGRNSSSGHHNSNSNNANLLAAKLSSASMNMGLTNLSQNAMNPKNAQKTTAASVAKSHPFISSLEAQGLVRVALTPDEVNSDLEGILLGAANKKNKSEKTDKNEKTDKTEKPEKTEKSIKHSNNKLSSNPNKDNAKESPAVAT